MKMKDISEPLFSSVIGLISFGVWTNLAMSLFLAFLSGALGYLGRYCIQQLIKKHKERKDCDGKI